MPLFRRDQNIPQKALLKRFALVYLPVVVIFLAALLASMHVVDRHRMENRELAESSRIETARALIAEEFNEVDTELRLLSNLPILRLYLDSGDPKQREELARLFLVLVREADRYDQVRYLDASGQEIIRVNRNNGKPAIVPQDQLQNKAERYYFRDTLKLDEGEIYASPLDLNIEGGRIEVPYKPTIRFGTPVFDRAGRKKGVIVVNYLGSGLIWRFRKVMEEHDASIAMMLNRDGYWLSSTKPEEEWGFMLGKTERTFAHDFPEEWHAISSGKRGTLRTAKGMFAYATLYPLQSGQHSSTGSAASNAPSRQEPAAHDYYWKLVSFIPEAALSKAALHNQGYVRASLGIACLLIALIAWVVANVTLSRERVRAELARSNARYDELTRRIPVGIYLVRARADGSVRFEYISEVFRRILGVDGDALLRDASKRFANAHPDDRERLVQRTQEALSSLQPFRWEGRFMVRGETHWIRLSSDPAPQPDGSCVWSGVVSDITERKLAEQTLALHAELVQHMAEGMVLIRAADGVIIFANPAFERMFGYGPHELIGEPVAALNAPAEKSPKEIADAITAGLRETGAWNGEIENIKKDGARFWCLVNVSTFVHPQYGEVWLSIHQDITERKQMTEALRRSMEETEDLYEHAPCGYHSLDENGLIVRMNHTELEWLGYTRDEVVGKMYMFELFTETDRRVFPVNFAQFKKRGYTHDQEIELVHKDGSVLPVLLNATAIYDADGRFVMTRSTVFDLAERKKLEHELERQARTDVLTGLNNRRHFLDLAELEIERSNRYGEPLTLLMLDVDNFKLVNDTYGHAVGDAVLKKLAEVCNGAVREIDLMGRLGGEEFAILLPQIDGAQGVEVAERLRQAISSTAVPLEQGGSLFVTVSIGVTSFEGARDDLKLMLRRADTALYAAKKAGRNRVCAEAID